MSDGYTAEELTDPRDAELASLRARLAAAEKERDEARLRIAMSHDDVEGLREFMKGVLPGWLWSDPQHDPLHAHPFEQVFKSACVALTMRALAAEAQVAAKKLEIEALVEDLDTLETDIRENLPEYVCDADGNAAGDRERIEFAGQEIEELKAENATLARVAAAAERYRKVAKAAILYPVAGTLWMESEDGMRLDAALADWRKVKHG